MSKTSLKRLPDDGSERPALPRTTSEKGVTIFDEPERIEAPVFYADDTPSPTIAAQTSKLHRASMSGKKLIGRPAINPSTSTSSLMPTMSSAKLDAQPPGSNPNLEAADEQGLLHQVMQWLQEEKHRQSKPDRPNLLPDLDATTKLRDGNVEPDQSLSLHKLERILAKYAGALTSNLPLPQRSSTGTRRASIARKLLKQPHVGTAASDTDGADAIAIVPHVEASLDNTKTLSYSGEDSVTASSESTDDPSKQKEQKNWETFKQDILRLTHTLGLRGWRRLPIEHGGTICVERLSGALTNAVYVAKPPKDINLFQKKIKAADGTEIPMRRSPKDLLVRVYGPQVEHLIDRETELMILRRLAAKNIGPKLLGYFTNGRFEEFLHAKTLKPQDIRDSSTSKQIAKRMKEMHEGIDLLEAEKAAGPKVFQCWESWIDRVEKVITWLDQQVYNEAEGKLPASPRYTRRGLICGADWKLFRDVYERYRAKLFEESGGVSGVRKKLVFAHNDTQYGNLMKLQPADKSPLLKPVNQHKQLVVIDFEYAGPNTRGIEFADHFNEWCYDYHCSAEYSYICNSKRYPNLEEQRRFVRAYVLHRPQFASSASSTPHFDGREKTSVPDFVLDARAPGGGYGFDYDAEERAREGKVEQEIEELLHETRLWRIANHAFWVTWGIVQAKIPELDDPPKKSRARAVIDKVKHTLHAHSDPLDEDIQELKTEASKDRPQGRQQEEAHREGSDNDSGNEDEEGDDSFDYLAYSQDRAMFFWGDCIQLGIVKEDELPEATRPHIKYVKY